MKNAQRRRSGEAALRLLRWALGLSVVALLGVVGHAGWRFAAASL